MARRLLESGAVRLLETTTVYERRLEDPIVYIEATGSINSAGQASAFLALLLEAEGAAISSGNGSLAVLLRVLASGAAASDAPSVNMIRLSTALAEGALALDGGAGGQFRTVWDTGTIPI